VLLTLVAATDQNGAVDENAVEWQSGGSFSRPLSGWHHWQTRDPTSGRVIDWSPSLAFDILPVKDFPPPPSRLAPSPSRQAAGASFLPWNSW
jgi:hypothetical protein